MIDSLATSPTVLASVLERLKNGEELGIIIDSKAILGLMHKDFTDTSE